VVGKTPNAQAIAGEDPLMMFESRESTRRFFFEVWSKATSGEALAGMERIVADVIGLHPEYHEVLSDVPHLIKRDFGRDDPEHNPFLHMGLHIALREQLAADRPAGVCQIHADLLAQSPHPHEVEHQMIECLATELWHAQSAGRLPDEQAYLRALRQLGPA
jgi:hypothetical protein